LHSHEVVEAYFKIVLRAREAKGEDFPLISEIVFGSTEMKDRVHLYLDELIADGEVIQTTDAYRANLTHDHVRL
jgi:hypothetical protein